MEGHGTVRTFFGVVGLLVLLAGMALGCAGPSPTSYAIQDALLSPGPSAVASPFPEATPSTRAGGRAMATPLPSPSLRASITAGSQPTRTPAGSPEVSPVRPTNTPTTAPTETPVPTATPLVFAVVGDSRGGTAVYQSILEAVSADGSQFLIHTGDLVHTGSESEFVAFAEMMAGFPLPFYPVPGNHDAQAGDLTWFLRYSGAPAAHYSFDWGSVHLTLADSHHGVLPQAALQWIEEDLAQSAQPIKIVVLHHPPYDPDGSSHILARGNQAFLELMSEQEVDYVFCGHIHAFAIGERNGTVYVITGGGGAPLYTAGHPQAYHHYVRASVQPDEAGDLKVDVEVVRISP
jgi:predicted phosphodiesterase